MTVAEATGGRRISGERIFFTAMALVVLGSTFIGFAPTYYLRFMGPPPHPVEPLIPLVFVHGMVFSAWVLLFVAQTALVAKGDLAVHRKLGLAGVGLLGLMIPLAIAVGVGGIHRPLTAFPGIDPLSWAAVPLLDVPLFTGLIGGALLNRKRPQVHKRLMLCAMVDMMRPSLGRVLPAFGFGPNLALTLPLLFLLPLILWDLKTRRRVEPATLWGSLAVVAVSIGTLLVWETPAWLGLARLLAGI
jgi:hypothetical protein